MNAHDNEPRLGAGQGSHFLDLHDLSSATLRSILDDAAARKAARVGWGRAVPDADTPLAGKALALIFEKPSTRTRVSFDMGMRQLGGETIVLGASDMQLGRGETVADTARVLSRYVDGIMIRCASHNTLLELAENATVPVINGLTDATHPCQVMADIMTVEERLGPIAGRKVAWSGDGNNVAASWIHAAERFGFRLDLACPKQLLPDPAVVAWATSRGADVRVVDDPYAAVEGADVVVTDTWVSMSDDEETAARRHNQLAPYQVNAHLMAAADNNAIFLHCLPAHRGEEATSEVLDGPQSAVFDEAENRLHAQKSVLRWCMG